MHEVSAAICRQRAVVDGWDGAGVNKGSLNQIVDKEEKQHHEGQVGKGTSSSYRKARRAK